LYGGAARCSGISVRLQNMLAKLSRATTACSTTPRSHSTYRNISREAESSSVGPLNQFLQEQSAAAAV
jgi:hypothetical protein